MSLSNPTKTATIHWDGTTWATAPSPTKLSAGKATENWLFSVSCTSGTNCFAVGQYSDGRNTQTLVLRLSSGPGTGGCPSGSSLLCGIIDILNPDVGVSITAGPLTVSGEVTLQSSPSAPAPGPDSNPLPIGGLPTGIEVGPAAAPSANPSSGDDGLLGVLLRFFGLGHGTPAAPVEGLPAAPIGLPVATQPSSAAQAGAQSPAASQRVVLLLDGVEVGHDDVATSEAAPTDAWSIDTAVAAGAHLLHATWTDGDGETIASAERAITVSAGDCAADDNTCVPVDNHAPVVDTVLSTLQTVANDLPATIGLSGGAHDDNGIGDSSGKIAAAAGSVSVSSIQRGTTPICLGTGAGCIIVDAATVEGVAGSPTDVTYSLGLGLPAGLAEGTYTVTVTATDSAGLTGGKTVAFEAYAPGGFVLHIDGGALHFGDAIAPGQAATSSNFVLVHNTHKDTDGVFAPADLRFQMSPFRSASGEQFTAVDHLILGIDPTGAGDFTAGNAQAFTVDYSSSLQSLSQMPADGSWAIQLTLAVPVGTGAGSYGSTFGVA
jgi:hypothetical protein